MEQQNTELLGAPRHHHIAQQTQPPASLLLVRYAGGQVPHSKSPTLSQGFCEKIN